MASGISFTLARSLARAVERHGLAASDFLRAVECPEEAPPETRVSLDRVGSVLEELAAKRGIPHLSLELAKMLPLGTLGVTDYYVSSTATFWDACLRASIHIPLLNDTLRLELEIEADGAHIVQRHKSPNPRIIAELTAAISARRMTDLLGESIAFTVVRFTHAPPGPLEPYQAYFSGPVEFGAPANDLVFPPPLFARPLLTTDPELAKILREHPTVAAMRASLITDTFMTRVRADIARSLADGGATLPTIAKKQKMSVRSFQRRMSEAGNDFSAVLDDVRRDLATTLLSREGIVLADVASQLGFSDLTAFFKAFRRWTGTTPRAFQSRLVKQ